MSHESPLDRALPFIDFPSDQEDTELMLWEVREVIEEREPQELHHQPAKHSRWLDALLLIVALSLGTVMFVLMLEEWAR